MFKATPFYQSIYTVDLEIFAIILFSRIVLKYILAALKIRDLDMIYVKQ